MLSAKSHWLWAFGIACGLGMLSKYTTAFYILGLLAGLLFTSYRSLFYNRVFWMAALLAVIIFLPNLWWQYQHRFPVVNHMQELRETQLVHISASGFLLDQLLMILPAAFIWIAGLVFCLLLQAGKKWRWIGIMYLVVIALLMAGSGKGYYALGLYPLLLSFGAAHIGKWMTGKAVILRWAIALLPVIPGLAAVPLGLPVFEAKRLARFYEDNGYNKMPFFVWEDLERHELPQDFADMMGWEEITAMVARQWQLLPDSVRQHTMLYCRGYFTAGAINYYRKKYDLPEAVSDNGSYLLWMPQKYTLKNLALVGHKNPGPDDEVFNHFQSRRVLDSLSLPLFRENGIKVYLFENADSAALPLIEKGIREEKAKFTR